MKVDLLSSKTLEEIHRLQRQALEQDNQSTYWALALAIDFALDITAHDARVKDIARIERALLKEVQS